MKQIFTALALVSCIFTYSIASESALDLPVLKSANATPSPQDTIAALTRLKTKLTSALNDRILRNAKIGVCIADAQTGNIMYERNSTTPLTPASTTKLFSTFTAYHILGPHFTVPTSVWTDAATINDGVIDGNLYVAGSGDPLFTADDAEFLMQQLVALGIKQVKGKVFADGTFFDGITDRKTYAGDRDHVQRLAPISGLTINRNRIRVHISANGKRVGQRAVAYTSPASDAVDIKVTCSVKRGRYYHRSVKVRSYKGQDGKLSVTVGGKLAPGRATSYTVELPNPDMFVAGMFHRRLRDLGIQIDSGFGVAPTPMFAERLTEFYRPLTEIVDVVNKNSDNFCAEHVFKMLGAYSGVNNNTADESRHAIAGMWDNMDIDCKDCAMNDGSGLSRRNLFTPRALTDLLIKAQKTEFATPFYYSLAVAGIDGTLKRRMRGTTAFGNLVGKTGTLRNVSALSGYVTTRDGNLLAFSLLFNGRSVSHYKSVENRIGTMLADFSYKPQ